MELYWILYRSRRNPCVVPLRRTIFCAAAPRHHTLSFRAERANFFPPFAPAKRLLAQSRNLAYQRSLSLLDGTTTHSSNFLLLPPKTASLSFSRRRRFWQFVALPCRHSFARRDNFRRNLFLLRDFRIFSACRRLWQFVAHTRRHSFARR